MEALTQEKWLQAGEGQGLPQVIEVAPEGFLF